MFCLEVISKRFFPRYEVIYSICFCSTKPVKSGPSQAKGSLKALIVVKPSFGMTLIFREYNQ